MKKKLIIQDESLSKCHSPIHYVIVRSPPLFTRTDVYTVFPDLAEYVTNARALTFPDKEDAISNTSQDKGIYCIVTFQPCVSESLIVFSDEATEFKDISRERFIKFMQDVQMRLKANHTRRLGSLSNISDDGVTSSSSDNNNNGICCDENSQRTVGASSADWFVDWTDPATGLPYHSNSSSSVYCEADGIEQLLKIEVVYINGPGGGCRMVVHPLFGMDVYPATGFVCGGSEGELLACLDGL
eukprot:Tbor_TRINITY_DN6312_c0_g1::TRINITY_DN6312_c0_g1_i1::g.17842::m.17842